ncbi:L,D-transpeptidase [Candidatus Falkowbacteria bacterium]|nr:L,D-transpeptidase [Candidatus Falkowbacteria bacterium]
MKTFLIYITTFSIILTPLSSEALAKEEFSFVKANDVLVIDNDNDGLTDLQELHEFGTDPVLADTDGDGYRDGVEIENLYSPRYKNKLLSEVDSDKDGVNDLWELRLGSHMLLSDTDGDGVSDSEEIELGYMPTRGDVVVKKRIEVDINNYTMSYYHGDVLLEKIAVSTGKKGWETPKGSFSIKNKVDYKNYFNHPNTPYNLEFAFSKGWRIYIHTASWHNEFGKKNMSTGCVNVPEAKMKEIYAWATVGTSVNVF